MSQLKKISKIRNASLQFYILDIFAEEKYAGNQLAVIRNAAKLSDKQMQKIAREMNFSETTFILSEHEKNGGFDVRIFTPNNEVPFAGHPTLGTAYVIQKEIIKRTIKNIKLNLKIGQIPVSFEYSGNQANTIWMKQIEPTFGKIIKTETILEVLGLKKSDIDKKFPVQEVSTGLSFIMVPLKNLKAVKKAKINKEKYFRLIENTKSKAIFVFCPDVYNPKNNINARMFADYYGIPEDPATGSANGCLAGYLVKHRYFGTDKINIRVEQGYEINRPSLLYLKAEENDGKIDIFVGGKVVMVASGSLL